MSFEAIPRVVQALNGDATEVSAVICRSAVKPVILGLGTAAVLAAGGTSALAAADPPSPSPSVPDSPSATPKPELLVDVVAGDSSVTAGESASFKIKVTPSSGQATEVRVTNITVSTDPEGEKLEFGGACPPPGCDLEDVGEDGKAVTTLVSLVAGDIDEPVSVTFEATVEGVFGEDVKDDGSGKATVTFEPVKSPPTTPPPSTSSPAPKPKPSRTPSKPAKKPSPSPSKSSAPSSSGGSGGSGGSSGGGSGSVGGGSHVPTVPNSTFTPEDPQVSLPSIQAPSPSVAPVPGAVATPQSRLQSNRAPVAQEVTFERMASTQIAWLAALLVAFSLLLTQLRLGRRRAPVPVRGAHRRPRRGLFGK